MNEQCTTCDWINFCIPDECPGYDIHVEDSNHCPNCGKDCTDNLYFINTGLCQACDTL